MKRALVLGASMLTVAFAAQEADRIIRFDPNIKFSGNLRTGPYNFNGTAATPVVATVNNMKISALRAVLSAPAGTSIASAEGKRTAEFSENVTVNRGRLNAKGPALTYSEVSGDGVLKGGATAVFAPEKDEDPVNIAATQMTFDVDTNISTSKGNVKLVNGSQSGTSDTLVFDEKRELALLTGAAQMNRAASGKQKALTITGDEARVLTKDKLMFVKNKVKLISGDITTTGESLFYDDKKNLAVIVGNAVSVNAKDGTKVTGNVLEQRTDLGRVRQLTGAYKIPAEQFKLSTEK